MTSRDVANQLVWIALQHDCSTIVFESLGALESSDASGNTAWSNSSWARGDLLHNVDYRAELLALNVDTVNPWGTGRYCPRCSERERTARAPNDHEACRHGGHFHCHHCGYECDRDVVRALNVGRKWHDECKMERPNPAAYMAGESRQLSNARSVPFACHSDTDAGPKPRQCLAFSPPLSKRTRRGVVRTTVLGGVPHRRTRARVRRAARTTRLD